VVRIAPWPLDFLGGAHMPNVPKMFTIIPRMWGILPVYRGTGSRAALRAGEACSLKVGHGQGFFARPGLGLLMWQSIRGPGCCRLVWMARTKLFPPCFEAGGRR
jgi:1-acyl-sn-glycerol-3-phosphate acyltransferase